MLFPCKILEGCLKTKWRQSWCHLSTGIIFVFVRRTVWEMLAEFTEIYRDLPKFIEIYRGWLLEARRRISVMKSLSLFSTLVQSIQRCKTKLLSWNWHNCFALPRLTPVYVPSSSWHSPSGQPSFRSASWTDARTAVHYLAMSSKALTNTMKQFKINIKIFRGGKAFSTETESSILDTRDQGVFNPWPAGENWPESWSLVTHCPTCKH